VQTSDQRNFVVTVKGAHAGMLYTLLGYLVDVLVESGSGTTKRPATKETG
jgi:hypothetical protein